ncbi:MAG: diphosphate--fructose-6-phosphate 1-phosphotransferase [Clostridiales bacterium]|nr:diphosphate--fructose-6-phosphate 1-phosphotransferase [Clostridiales bacterium]
MSRNNALVALGGGPSPVINASLLGVVEACRDFEHIDGVYGALHGIEGVLKEELVRLDTQDPAELAKLRHTPASGVIGTCRYKLGKDERAAGDYLRALDVFRAHGVGYFFYIGGNDSMDTAHKISVLAREKGEMLVCAGIPKTIDNDLGDEARTLIDHTPGFGSTARYWAMLMKDAEEENRGMYVSEPVSVFQTMGRKAGFITAAARLADPGRRTPLQMYFAETGQGIEDLYENVCRSLRECGRAVVVVSEGFNIGTIREARDGFGHIEYGASDDTAMQAVVSFLNRRGLPVRGNATGQIPGVMQRSTGACRSEVDEEEAYEAGRHAVKIALSDGTGYMATILRDYSAPGYSAYFSKVPMEVIANSARGLPREWIAKGGTDVTDAYIDYAMPLIGEGMRDLPVKAPGGLPDFARLDLSRAEKRLEAFIPVNHRILEE